MSELLTHLVRYVPPTLLRQVLALPKVPEAPAATQFPGAVLLADVSGFTPLAEALAQQGAEGSEELTRLLNHYFSRMIALLEAEGGEVVKFSGDAVTALFPARDEPLAYVTRRALQAAEAMQEAMGEFATMPTSAGPIALGMKIGLGAGTVRALQIGGVGNRWESIFAGEAIRQAISAEGMAGRGEIVLSPSAGALLHEEPLPRRGLEQVDWSAVEDPAAVTMALRCFVPRTVLNWLDQGLDDWLAVLRPMSVLFAGLGDVVTETMQSLHPFLRAAQETIERYEGSLGYLGAEDKGVVLLALFGAPPLAHEDDPLRAVRCALDLVQAANVGLHLRIGVATGQVFVGPVGGETRREYTVIGDTVNLAARLMGKVGLENLAHRQSVLCDYATFRQVQGQLPFLTLPPVRVKGKAGLVRVYQPITPSDRAAAVDGKEESPAAQTLPANARATSPLIGRQEELAHLNAALEAVLNGKSRLLIIEGEAGIGKSRLIAAFTDRLKEHGIVWLFGAGQSIEQQTPYRAWRSLFHFYFDLDERATSTERHDSVRSLVQQVAPEQLPRLPLLNDLLQLGLPDTDLTASLDPALRQQNLFLLLLSLLRAWARERPLVLILEDAHWLDSLSWEFAGQAARAMSASRIPFLLLLATRPMDPHTWGGKQLAQLRALVESRHLPLAEMSPEETVDLATARLGLPEGGLPEPVAELVRERAGGNPFFAEELVFMLRDQGLIRADAAAAEARLLGEAGLLLPLHLPDTVQGLVLARIDRLPPERQLVLKVASVIGRTFLYPTLRYTLEQHTPISDQVLREHLDELADLDLTPLDTPEPDLAYIFKHIITREVAYETLLFAQRRQLHRTVAEWYESSAGVQRAAPLLVHHYHQAGEEQREAYYARLAGEQAAAQFATSEAVTYFSRALELVPEEDLESRYELLLARERVYNLRGEREAQQQDLLALERLADSLARDSAAAGRRRAEVALGQAKFAEITGDYTAADQAIQRAYDLAQQLQATDLEAAANLRWGIVLSRQGEYDRARLKLERAIELSHEVALPLLEAEAQRYLGNTALFVGDFDAAWGYYSKALETYQKGGDRQGEASALNNLGLVLWRQDDYEGARRYFEQTLYTRREIGHRYGESASLGNLGGVTGDQGDYARARAYYQQALLICREIGDRWGEGLALNNLGLVAMYVGNRTEAEAYCRQALEIRQGIGDRRGEGVALVNLSLLAHQQGEHEPARNYGEKALQIAQNLGNRHILGYALTVLGHNQAALGDLKKAAATYEDALKIRRALGQPSLAMEPLAGLARTHLARNTPEATSQALAAVEEILQHLELDEAAMEEAPRLRLEGTMEPFRVCLTCYIVLRATQDPRAGPTLRTIYRVLQEGAKRISDDDMRRSFLENVAAHREIDESTSDYAQ
jgi:predicted ATPase/class 3 adenylate cyclase